MPIPFDPEPRSLSDIYRLERMMKGQPEPEVCTECDHPITDDTGSILCANGNWSYHPDCHTMRCHDPYCLVDPDEAYDRMREERD